MCQSISEFCLYTPCRFYPDLHVSVPMDQENAYDHTCLRRLDNDVLLQIIQAHLPRDDLRSLSLTSTWMRQLCMPTLFSKCSINSQALSSGPENFISESIRSYVRCVLPPYARPFSSHPHLKASIARTPLAVYMTEMMER